MEEKIVLPKPPKSLRQQKTNEPEPQNEIVPEKVEAKENQKTEEKRREKKKINFVPIINWAGLALSVGLFAVFLYLLCS